jgi:uncharacterized protein (DUF2062 family)
MSEGFFSRRLVRPLLDLLRQGVTPEKIALSVALGVMLGVFPVLGSTTALCALAAFAWQLNLPSIQIVNYFAYPLRWHYWFPSSGWARGSSARLICPFLCRGFMR